MKKSMIIVSVSLIIGWGLYQTLGVENQENKERLAELNQSEEIQVSNKVTDQGEGKDGEGGSSISVGLQPGDQAPPFTLRTLHGETISLSDYQGKKVILNFWATWCPPCRAEMPDMQKLYEVQQQNGFEIVAVNLTETEANVEKIEPFLEEYGITFPVLVDEDSSVALTYQAYSVPTSYFIDSHGIIQKKYIGPMNHDWMQEQLNQME